MSVRALLVFMSCLFCSTAFADEHAAHRQVQRDQQARVSTVNYETPDVVLQRSDGRSVRLRELLAPGRPVALNFIFTSCTTICPVMTATTLQLQRELAGHRAVPDFISISIDPQFDSAPVLQGYARRYGANWTFLTGDPADVARVLQAFDAWRGSKGNHSALTVFRAPRAQGWTRVDGLASAQTLASVWREIAAGVHDADLVAAGRTLYRTGRRADGSALEATVQHDVPLPASACVNCHRRSGLGASEGSVRALPVVAPLLFAPVAGGVARPAYDDATLLRALTSGVAASGRTLDPLMPRYRLTSEDARSLLAYLHTLGNPPSPGVDESHIELATVIADDAPPAQREALEQVVSRFVTIKNGGMRREASRAAAARRHQYGEQHARAFRVWNHRFWRLTGPQAGWREQLETLYREHPPFAVLSGTTGPQWLLRDFCEARQLPCILPLAASAERGDTDFYTLYFADDAQRDASVTARHLDRTLPRSTRVVLVTNTYPVASRARHAFAEIWAESGRPPVRELLLGADGADLRSLREQIAAAAPDVLIAWLPAEQLQSLALRTSQRGKAPIVYTAESFTPWQKQTGGAAPGYHVYPYRLPQPGLLQFPREQTWLRSQELAQLEPLAASHALFACHALGEALAGIEGNFSRDYLMEQLEHMLDGTRMTSIYPAVTLGPDQRVLARGAYVVDVAAGARLPDSPWLQAL